ncbi:DUF4926 domain-containing protein [Leptolyngbya sp. PCC 6406]|uniref:DUF4926 domain-containing protein n=1 Tax=Leptolyngbya sp. PCC 6406 TaxID=1173264 RepID=UPI0002AC952F|nr:DUF4926 domain-containing protein [Leptolyngbya sp. PCC 6406]
MSDKYSLFSKVALAIDLPEHNLKRGSVATIVEHYPMADGEEDGYSLEGFNVPNITVEVIASQIIPVHQWEQEAEILAKLRQLSPARLLQIEEYIDFMLQKDAVGRKSA